MFGRLVVDHVSGVVLVPDLSVDVNGQRRYWKNLLDFDVPHRVMLQVQRLEPLILLQVLPVISVGEVVEGTHSQVDLFLEVHFLPNLEHPLIIMFQDDFLVIWESHNEVLEIQELLELVFDGGVVGEVLSELVVFQTVIASRLEVDFVLQKNGASQVHDVLRWDWNFSFLQVVEIEEAQGVRLH